MLPQRIVCLTEEPTEVLYALGEAHRIVGISGFTVRPPCARQEKPRVSAFTSADIGAILALAPDLVIGFSDLQAEIARDLIRAGVEVWISNHRDVEGILGYVHRLGAMVGAVARAEDLVASLRAGIEAVRLQSSALTHHPRVYFEEWDEPAITGITWVCELIRIAGGIDIFPERALPLAKDRILADPMAIADRHPDIVLASWCGKKFRPEQFRARAGFASIPAVRDGELHEIDSSTILQPGPAALTDGLQSIAAIIRAWSRRQGQGDPAT